MHLRVTSKRPTRGGMAVGLQGNWSSGVSPDQWLGRAAGPLLGQQQVAEDSHARDGRHSPTISSTLRECVPPQRLRTNSTVQRVSPELCMAARVKVSGSGSPHHHHGHVRVGPRPGPAHSVPEIPADSARATSEDSERASASGG